MTSVESTIQSRPAIVACLARYARRRHALALLRAIGQAIVIAIVWLTIWGVIDRFIVVIPPYGRLLLLIVLVLLLARVVRQSLIRFLRGDVNWLAIASEIEARDPRFGEALLTVVSESLSLRRHRASPEMVDQLTAKVESLIRSTAHPASPPMAPARFAAGIAAIGLAVFISLLFWPRLGMRDLVARQVMPMADLAPVKTTQLHVQTGSTDVPQGNPFPISATVEQLRGSTVMLRTSTDNRNWTAVGMTPLGNGLYTHTLPAITRDLTYQVTAGDAASELAFVRVLRRPLVRDLRIRLVYPKYVARDPLVLTSAGGIIQAPRNTEATIIVTPTEPLKSATFIIDGQRIEGRPGPDARSWQTQFTIERDMQWQLEMVSDRDYSGSGPGDMPIHAIPDRAPIAKLVVPERSLLLRPQDSVRIAYQAADDYALGKLEARISVNNTLALTIPLPLGGDPQRVDDAFALNLSECKASIGDLVTAVMAATDRAGQTTQSGSCQILISSQPVTADQRGRVAQLGQAAQLATAITRDLDAVQPGAAEAKQAHSKISSACESAALLAQSLLRANAAVQDQQLADMLAFLADAAAVQSSRLEQLNARIDMPDMPENWIARQREEARKLQMLVQSIWRGLSSEVIVAEQAGLNAARAQTDASLVRFREDVDAELHELDIDTQAASVANELQSRITDARRLMSTVHPIDVAQAAEQWAAANEPRDGFLSERFSIAAQIEAIRVGADLDWARDLQSAARAVRAVDSRGVDAARKSVADAVALVERGHRADKLPQADQPQARTDALAARRALRLWAGESSVFASTPTVETNPRQINAAATQESDTREQMLSSIRQAQEDLAELPLQLGRIEQSVQISRQSQGVARQADRDAQAAPADGKAVAERAAEIARVQSDEAFAGISEISQEIDPNQLHAMIHDLQAFGADTSSAAAMIGRQLEPALTRLRDRIDGRDPDGIDQAIVEVRNALSASQDELRRARQTVLDKDPLVAARWFARQQVLPSSRPSSTQPQNETLAGLGRAWDDSLRRVTEARMAAGPSTQPSPRDNSPVGLFQFANSPRPWLDPDLIATAGARDDDPQQFKDALRVYFKVLGRPESDIEP